MKRRVKRRVRAIIYHRGKTRALSEKGKDFLALREEGAGEREGSSHFLI